MTSIDEKRRQIGAPGEHGRGYRDRYFKLAEVVAKSSSHAAFERRAIAACAPLRAS
jgi:hypothetical protein